MISVLRISMIFLVALTINKINGQQENIINRSKGNILRNLTRTQQYQDNIVTSQLDASNPIRQFYRGFREVYKRYSILEMNKKEKTNPFDPNSIQSI